jgi:hypothetical protein
MSSPAVIRRNGPNPTPESSTSPEWLALVADKVRTMRFGVVQVVVHDGKVVQVERTERTRFDVSRDGRDA